MSRSSNTKWENKESDAPKFKNYKLNQTAGFMKDSRTKRNRTRADNERHAVEESYETE